EILHKLDEALERSNESPFGRDDFGLDSFPPHRDLADAIVASDPVQAVAAINNVLDKVRDEIEMIIETGLLGVEAAQPGRVGRRG
ncbi:MAG: FadR family transcriptional regulator, partial [Devosia sp.]|nr:FadR family transcriptional regulator [Devosia sp.]